MLLVNAPSRFSGFYYDDSGLANVTFLIKILSENVVIKTNGWAKIKQSNVWYDKWNLLDRVVR